MFSEKIPQIAIESDKFPTFYGLSRFNATFVNFPKNFMDQNVENVQEQMNSLSNWAVLWKKKLSQWPQNSHNSLICSPFWFSSVIF